jgi:hypothetical protein
LVARHLEENGLPTVIVGSARDIVEHCGVPRFLFTDFPLGNPCGLPWDRAMQREIVAMALRLLESAEVPRTTLRAPFEWNGEPGWRQVYNRIRPEDRDRLLAIGDARRKQRGQAARKSS